MAKKALPLPLVTGITLVEGPDAFVVSWNAVEGATKYVLKVEAFYDMGTPGDVSDDEYREIDAPVTAGLLTVSIPKTELSYAADETGGGGAAPMKITADVKPKDVGRQGKKRRGVWSGTPAVWPAA
jgi:hypothetical protein